MYTYNHSLKMRFRYPFHLVFISLLGLLSAQAEVTIRAYFDPPSIPLGDRSQYIVEITETSTRSMPNHQAVNSLDIPPIENLSLRNGRISTSQRTNIINFEQEYSLTQSVVVEADPSQLGTYTIPNYTVEYKGKAYSVTSTQLKVTERDENAPPGIDELIYLQIDLPESLYLGQSIESELKLFVSTDINLRGLNGFDRNADSFTVSELPDDPQERVEIIDGRRYRVISWPLEITPIRSGEQPIDFQLTISAVIPQSRNSRDPYGSRSPFGSSIFDDMFGRTERLNLYTDSTTINVKPLPTKNQPSTYSGAIGDFSMEVFSDTESTSVGEPIMLSLKLNGKGNFSRINGPELPASPAWRHYKPESTFEPRNDSDREGTKRFDYVFIPMKAGQQALPAINFAFFDPETEEYVELKGPPIEVAVKPSTRAQAPLPSTQTGNTEKARPTETPAPSLVNPEERLFTLDYQPKSGKSSINSNPLKNKSFWIINGLLAFATLGGYLYLRRREKYRNSETFALVQACKQALQQTRKELKAACDQNNHESFYLAAQNAIRLQLSICTGKNLKAASSAEIERDLNALSIETEQLLSLRTILTQADAIRFSGLSSSSSSSHLESTYQKLQNALNKLS